MIWFATPSVLKFVNRIWLVTCVSLYPHACYWSQQHQYLMKYQFLAQVVASHRLTLLRASSDTSWSFSERAELQRPTTTRFWIISSSSCPQLCSEVIKSSTGSPHTAIKLSSLNIKFLFFTKYLWNYKSFNSSLRRRRSFAVPPMVYTSMLI